MRECTARGICRSPEQGEKNSTLNMASRLNQAMREEGECERKREERQARTDQEPRAEDHENQES